MAKIAFRKIWEEVRKKVFLPETGLLLPTVSVFHKYNKTVPTAHVKQIRKNRYEVVYGIDSIKTFLNEVHGKSDVVEKKKQIVLMYMSYFYHELAHVKYTDMTMGEFKKITEPIKQSYAAKLANVLEDAYIQYVRMPKDYPYTKKIFLDNDKKMFRDSVLTKYKDKNDLPSLFNYLLFSTRRGRVFKGENGFITAHEEEVNNYVIKFLNEHDAVLRSRVAIEFLEWILSTGEIVLPETPDADGAKAIASAHKESISGGGETTGLDPVVYESKPKDPVDVESEYSEPVEDEEDFEPDIKEEYEEEDGRSDTIFHEIFEEEVSEDALEAEIKEVVEPDPYVTELDVLELNHEFIDLSGYTDDWQPVQPEDLEAINVIGKSTTKSIMVKLERDKPRWVGGKDSGKLDVGAVIARTDGKVFKDKKKELPIPKLAFSVLMDNSGSISSTQTEVSSVASLALVKACEELEIPIELNAFTCDRDRTWHDNTWVTWEIKTFEEEFNDGIKKIGRFIYANSFNIEGHHGFGGNMEEVNIAHIGSRLTRKHPDRHNVMIVLCDGQTTGSTSKLRNVLETIGKDVYVIGIGLGVDLSHIYKRTFTLSSVAEVSRLPLLMRDILKEFVFGEE